MRAANVTVAEKIVQHFPTMAMLRRHANPEPASFDELVKAARVMGFELDFVNEPPRQSI